MDPQVVDDDLADARDGSRIARRGDPLWERCDGPAEDDRADLVDRHDDQLGLDAAITALIQRDR